MRRFSGRSRQRHFGIRAFAAALHGQRLLPVGPVQKLERAVAMREKDGGDPPALAESRFALARALGKTDRGKALAAQARDAYRAAGKSFDKQADEIERWLR